MRKTLSALLTIALGAALALIGVAAPAAAHHNTITVSVACAEDLSYTVTWRVANSEGISETVTSSSDSSIVPVGTVVGPGATSVFTQTVAVPTTKTLTLAARWTNGVTASNSATILASAFPSSCAYPPGYDLQCDELAVDYGRALKEGDHINMDITVDGTTFQRSAYVDKNVEGGWNGFGLRINGFDPIPLTEAQVKSGRIVFAYSSTFEHEVFTVEWVQMNSSYFNQGRSSAVFLHCGEPGALSVQAAPSATTPSCEADGSLVIPVQEHVVFTGGANGAGPGSYTITAASATEQYRLIGTTSWEITVLPKLSGPECQEIVSLPLDPYATPESCATPDADATGVGMLSAAGRLPGAITVLHEEHVVFDVDGEVLTPDVEEGESWPFWETYPYPAGSYTVTATLDEEFRFEPEGPTSWVVVIEEPESVPCNVEQLQFAPASASAADESCVAGEHVPGSITVGLVDGVSYAIDGSAVTQETTPVEPGGHIVTAAAEPGLQLDGQDRWEFEVAAADAGCGQLALTGLSGTGWTAGLALFSALLGGGLLLMMQAVRRRAAGPR